MFEKAKRATKEKQFTIYKKRFVKELLRKNNSSAVLKMDCSIK